MKEITIAVCNDPSTKSSELKQVMIFDTQNNNYNSEGFFSGY